MFYFDINNTNCGVALFNLISHFYKHWLLILRFTKTRLFKSKLLYYLGFDQTIMYIPGFTKSVYPRSYRKILGFTVTRNINSIAH